MVHKVPTDLRKTLTSDPKAFTAWKDITPLARKELIDGSAGLVVVGPAALIIEIKSVTETSCAGCRVQLALRVVQHCALGIDLSLVNHRRG